MDCEKNTILAFTSILEILNKHLPGERTVILQNLAKLDYELIRELRQGNNMLCE